MSGPRPAIRLYRSATGLFEAPGPMPSRTGGDVLRVEPPTYPIPRKVASDSEWRSTPPRFSPELGGCVTCGHVRAVHTRGRDTGIPCTARHCRCPGFRQPGWGWRDWAKFWLVTVLVATATVEIVAVAAATLAARGWPL